MQSLDVLLNAMEVRVIVRTSGDFNVFSCDTAYCDTDGFPVHSRSCAEGQEGCERI